MLLDSMYIRFKYRQNYVLRYLSMQTNMAKINRNKQKNLKIQESGDLWGKGKGMELGKGPQKLSKMLVIKPEDGIWVFVFLLFFKVCLYILNK